MGWIQQAKRSIKKRGTQGVFRRKAKAAGMTTAQFARHVLANKSRYSAATRKQAALAKAFATARKGRKK